MQVFNKIWAIVLLLSAFSWLFDAIYVVMGHKNFSPLTLFAAFLITGVVVFKWAIEAWQD